PGGDRQLGAVLPIAGHVQPEVRIIPARVLLGSRPISQVAEATVVLQIPPGEDWTLDHVEVDSPDLRVEVVRVNGVPEGRTYRLVQKVTKEGDQSSIARFVLRTGGQKLNRVETEVAYRGEPIKPEREAR